MEGSETDSEALMITVVWQKGKTSKKIVIFVHQCYLLFIYNGVSSCMGAKGMSLHFCRSKNVMFLVDVKDRNP